jgi:sarcosine oxidase subunit gamma
MIENPRRESPLVRFGSPPRLAQDERLAVVERPFLGHVNLRGSPRSQPFNRACQSVLGYSLPRKPNTCEANGNSATFWLGPEEWLILTPPDGAGPLIARLEATLEGRFYAVNDISSGHTVIALSGSAAPGVVHRGCGLDVHPKVFQSGRCAQTAFAKSSLLLCKWDESPCFELVIRRSFAEYLWLWLTHTVRAV